MESIHQFFTIGGPVVAILALFSVAASAVALIKAWQLWQWRGAGPNPVEKALDHIEAGDRARAQLLLADRRNPRADLVARTLQLLDNNLSREDVKAEIARRARAHLNNQGSHLRILEVIATTAPLLGLLGTVLGMITAFQALQNAGTQVNPAVLSGGIWEALLTTAVGLVVAIPASLAHSWLERRVENTANQISDDIGRIFTIHAEPGDGTSGIHGANQQA